MEFINSLGTGAFILAPIALFCSQNGNGFILCVVLLILGGICKWIGGGGLNPTVRISRRKWWEEQYKARLGINSANKDKPDAKDDQIAKDIADWSTKSMKLPMPTEEEKEKIARAIGVTTYQMKYDEEDRWNRIQVEKYRLMEELYKKYKAKGDICSKDYVFGKRVGRVCCPYMYIKYSMMVLKDFITVYEWNQNPWTETASIDEKAEAKKWIDEYEKRLISEVNDYIENGISMPTIKKHKERGGRAIYTDYDVEYGFVKR